MSVSTPVTTFGAIPQDPTLQKRIYHYSLPYGAVGFASHLIAFYVITMLVNSRSPLTWRKPTRKVFDQIISALSITGSLSAGAMAISQCGSQSPFVAIGIWETAFSVTLGFISYHATSWIGRSAETDEEATIHGRPSTDKEEQQQRLISIDTCPEDGGDEDEKIQEHSSIISSQITEEENGNPAVDIQKSVVADHPEITKEERPTPKPSVKVMWWIGFYLPAAIFNFMSLLSLVMQTITQNRDVERITLVLGTFGSTAIILLSTALLFGLIRDSEKPEWERFMIVWCGFTVIVAMAIGSIGPLYSDWVLAVIAENLGGVPRTEARATVLYWVALVSRLLPLLSL